MKLPVLYEELSPPKKRLVREQYIDVQGGRCYYCNGKLNQEPPVHITEKWIYWRSFPPNFLKHPVHLHHNHDTGYTLGVVHAY